VTHHDAPPSGPIVEVATWGDRRWKHAGEVRAVVASPDGKHVFAGDSLGHVREWNIATGEPGRSLPPLVGREIRALAIAGDELFVAAGGTVHVYRIGDLHEMGRVDAPVRDDGILSLLAVRSGDVVLAGTTWGTLFAIDRSKLTTRALSSTGESILALAASPAGDRVLVGDVGGFVRELDVASLERRRSIKLQGMGVLRLLYAGADRAFALGDNGPRTSRIIVLDVTPSANSEVLEPLRDFSIDEVAGPIVPTDDGSFRLFAGWTSAVWSIDRDLSAITRLLDAKYHVAGLSAVAPIASGGWVTASPDGSVGAWDAAGKDLRTSKGQLGRIDSIACVGTRVITSGEDGRVISWDEGAPTVLRRFAGPVGHIAVLADGRIAVGAYRGEPGSIAIIDAAKPGTEAKWIPAGWCWSPLRDGRFLSTSTGAGAFQIFDESGLPIAGLQFGTMSATRILVASPDGTRAISVGNELRFWNLETRTELLHAPGTATPVACAIFAPAEPRLAILGEGSGRVSLYHSEASPRLESSIETGSTPLTALAATSRKTGLIATASRDGRIRVHATAGDMHPLLGDHHLPEDDYANSLAFTNDERGLAIGTARGVVVLLELRLPPRR
jgi:WD40 repeat protein